jgi:Domain of unknown function (DUF4247)
MRRRSWLVATALTALLGTASGCGSGADSPAEFVENKYERAASMDLDGGSRAYTSKDSVSTVEKAITEDWNPIERHSDGSGTYLRYGDDVVSIQDNGPGSVVRVEDIDTACPRYRSQIGINWTCNRVANTRGGGPGEGK